MRKYTEFVEDLEDLVEFLEMFAISIVVLITLPIWMPFRLAYKGITYLKDKP